MFYITEANAKRIITQIYWENSFINGQVYKQAIDFLNHSEIQRLLGIQELLKQPENFVKEVYQKAHFHQNPNYIYPDGAPAFHYYSDCENMNSDYSNIVVPDEIKAQGEEVVQEFRKWFMNHDYLSEDTLTFRCRMKFGLKTNFKVVRHENSGTREFKHNDVFELEKKINSLLYEVEIFSKESEKKAVILRRFSKWAYIGLYKNPFKRISNNTGYSDDEVKKILTEFDVKYKQPVKRLLAEWYRIKYNPDLQFSQHILKDLGFKECSSCARRMPRITSEDYHVGFSQNHLFESEDAA